MLGSFKVGDNSKIGAGSVVVKPVPPNSTVVGVPGQVVKRNNVRLPQSDLDQIHIPNPVSNDINLLKQENDELRWILRTLLNEGSEPEEQERARRSLMQESRMNNWEYGTDGDGI